MTEYPGPTSLSDLIKGPYDTIMDERSGETGYIFRVLRYSMGRTEGN